jgi:hypothetical protein
MMQIGTRWAVGQTPPDNLPELLVEAIQDEENGLTSSNNSMHWTLTWMERRPTCTLDSGRVLKIGPDGKVLRSDGENQWSDAADETQDDDDWLKP